MAEVSINAQRLVAYQDRTRRNRLSIWDVALNLAAETGNEPSSELQQLAYSALQWVQISSPYYPEMKNWSKLPDELINLKAAYEKVKYDFLEVRFDLKQAEEIEELLFEISARHDQKDCFSESEISLLKSISIYRDLFEAWVMRTGTKLPEFWFGGLFKENAESVVDDGGSSQVSQQRKRLKPLKRERNEALLLLYEIFDRYEVKYLDELKAIKAWNKIISKEFTSDLIKDISDAGKTINFKGVGKLEKWDFLEKYRKRFTFK